MINTYAINSDGLIDILMYPGFTRVVVIRNYASFDANNDQGFCNICTLWTRVLYDQGGTKNVCKGCAQQLNWIIEKLNNPRPYLSHLSKSKYIQKSSRNHARKKIINQSAMIISLIAFAFSPADIANLIMNCTARLIIITSGLD